MFFGLKLAYFRFFASFLALAVLCQAFSRITVGTYVPSLPTEPVSLSPSVTVVIDAGHGGEDGGASSASGALEKDLNLAVSFYLCDLLTANGISTVLTRTEDVLLYDRSEDYIGRKKILDLRARQKIAESFENCIFVSIHMNAYPLPQYGGLQVWYSPNDPNSLTLAESVRAAVRHSLQPDNGRTVKRATSSIYLLHNLQCPAILVECGFLSNPADAALLSTPSYQKQLATAIFMGIVS
jgi:N-acetylmuramoyl-L-alanine amidase